MSAALTNETIEPPDSPDDMPWDSYARDPAWMIERLADFTGHLHCRLSWEARQTGTLPGAREGEWGLAVVRQDGQCITASHASLSNLLWYVYTLSVRNDLAQVLEQVTRRNEARASALAKLTPYERKLLRLA